MSTVAITPNAKTADPGTIFLRRRGFTSGGNPKGKVDPRQSSFERRLLINPVYTRR